MLKKTIEIDLYGKDEREIRQIATALSIIVSRVPNEHIITIGEEIQKDPKVIGKVVNFSKSKIVKTFFKKK